MLFPSSSFLASAAAAFLLSSSSALAAPEPTSPDNSTSVAVGATLTTTWTVDTDGGWTDTSIRLYSGNNFAFQLVTPIATGIDASTLSSYDFVVPDVTPNSHIYFLVFVPTNATDLSLATYSTRFLITAADGSSTPPTNATQPLNDGVTPGGDAIPWGVGTLASAYSVTSPSNNTASTAAASSSTTAEAASSTVAASSSAAAEASSTGGVLAGASSSAVGAASSVAAAATSAASSASTGGASSVMRGSAFAGVAVGVVVGVVGLVL